MREDQTQISVLRLLRTLHQNVLLNGTLTSAHSPPSFLSPLFLPNSDWSHPHMAHSNRRIPALSSTTPNSSLATLPAK